MPVYNEPHHLIESVMAMKLSGQKCRATCHDTLMTLFMQLVMKLFMKVFMTLS